MLNYVGRRIQELAVRRRKYIRIWLIALGCAAVVAAVVLFFLAREYAVWWLLLLFWGIGMAVAAPAIAEEATIKLFGYGILVDRAERIKPEFLREPASCQPEFSEDAHNKQATEPESASPAPNTTHRWTCPHCDYINSPLSSACDYCGQSRPEA